MKKNKAINKTEKDQANSYYKQVQELEYAIEGKLGQFKEYTEQNMTSTWDSEVNTLEKEINDLLVQLEASLSKVDELILSESLHSSLQMRQIERYKNNLNEYRVAFKKQKTSIKNSQRRRTLLQGASLSKSSTLQEDKLMQEREGIESSSTQASVLIEQAYSTRVNLREQHSSLLGSNSRILNVTQIIPNMNLLLRKIRNKKRRDKNKENKKVK
ncbi:hypothetical protein BB561_001402 [Smittium simulii]|uniref:Uncharacterized protein n=1 Tax=Smittium simulii TaxID=133385 RepID=A0A2T9YUR3_9FUNG|nr:hypothetical protein BB561_001402 [Smittium simulii]